MRITANEARMYNKYFCTESVNSKTAIAKFQIEKIGNAIFTATKENRFSVRYFSKDREILDIIIILLKKDGFKITELVPEYEWAPEPEFCILIEW